jgi:hypothetical protein
MQVDQTNANKGTPYTLDSMFTRLLHGYVNAFVSTTKFDLPTPHYSSSPLLHPILHLVLSLTSEARNSYGLRRQEYGRYRHHCTQRLHRIRKTLGFTHGKDKSFATRPITAETVTDEK